MTRFLSGGNRFLGLPNLIGQGRPHPVPIALDPAKYEGAAIYGEDGQLYFSNRFDWIIPSEDVEISRPSARIPTTAEEQTQLRLSLFRSPAGLAQSGILFQISINDENFDDADERIVMDEFASLYQIAYPDDGFEPGDSIFWRARYLASEGGQSEFSVPIRQTFPELINRPSALTPVNANVGAVRVTEYDSAPIFGLNYFQTETQFYTSDGEQLLATVTHGNGGRTIAPTLPEMPEGTLFLYRSRYAGRVDVASPIRYSDWSTPRAFFNGVGAMLLEYNLDTALNRTVNLPIGVYDATDLNVTVNWGDGSPEETFTTGGVKSHVYEAEDGPIVNVSIRGSMRQYGGNTNQAGLKRVDNWGLKLQLTSLREALRNTGPTLEYVQPDLPPEVTSIRGLFQGATLTNAGLSIADLGTSNITGFGSVFEAANSNKPITNWDTGNATTLRHFCYGNSTFNQPVGHLNVSKVVDFSGAFGAPAGTNMIFNQSVNSWDVSNGEFFDYMFGVPSGFASSQFSYDQPQDLWTPVKAKSMVAMYRGTIADGTGSVFNQNIGSWYTPLLENINDFAFRSLFNNGGSPSINNWHTPSLTSATRAFQESAFNQPLNDWDMSSMITAPGMLRNTPFNHPVDKWDMRNATSLRAILSNNVFNQDVSMWVLNPDGVDINGPSGTRTFGSALSVNNASKLLVGWANRINDDNGPRSLTFRFDRNYDNRSFASDFPGGRFSDAVTARAWLTASRSVIVSDAGNATADGTYLWNAANSTYVNSSTDWHFIKVGGIWELRDDSNAVQATSGEGDRSEPYLETWGGALASATLLLGGAGWTIIGGSNVS